MQVESVLLALRLKSSPTCIAHELDTHGIDYVYHYFDLTHAVTFEELPLVGILAEALGKLDTATHTASELDILIESNLGHLSFFTDIYDRDTLDQARPAFIVAASALAEKTQGLASIPLRSGPARVLMT